MLCGQCCNTQHFDISSALGDEMVSDSDGMTVVSGSACSCSTGQVSRASAPAAFTLQTRRWSLGGLARPEHHHGGGDHVGNWRRTPFHVDGRVQVARSCREVEIQVEPLCAGVDVEVQTEPSSCQGVEVQTEPLPPPMPLRPCPWQEEAEAHQVQPSPPLMPSRPCPRQEVPAPVNAQPTPLMPSRPRQEVPAPVNAVPMYFLTMPDPMMCDFCGKWVNGMLQLIEHQAGRKCPRR